MTYLTMNLITKPVNRAVEFVADQHATERKIERSALFCATPCNQKYLGWSRDVWRQQGDDSDMLSQADGNVGCCESPLSLLSWARSMAAVMSSSSSSSTSSRPPRGAADDDVCSASDDELTAALPSPPPSDRKSTVSNRFPEVPARSRSTVAFRSNTSEQQLAHHPKRRARSEEHELDRTELKWN